VIRNLPTGARFWRSDGRQQKCPQLDHVPTLLCNAAPKLIQWHTAAHAQIMAIIMKTGCLSDCNLSTNSFSHKCGDLQRGHRRGGCRPEASGHQNETEEATGIGEEGCPNSLL